MVDKDFEMSDFASETEGAVVGPMFGVSYGLWSAFRTAGDKAIRVGRDPRDATVSLAFSLASSHVTMRETPFIRELTLSLDPPRRLILAMLSLLEGNVREFRSWAGRLPSASEFVTTYERIVADEEREFGAIFDFLEWPIPAPTVRAVVESHSFRHRSGGRERGELDAFSHYRRGVPGDWRNHFDRALATLFEETYPRLLVDLGYEDSETWWQDVPEHLERERSDATTVVEGEAADLRRQIEALAQAMTGALAERDARWSIEEAALGDRSARLEQAAADLLAVCEERLAVINEQSRAIAEQAAVLAQRDEKIAFITAEAEARLAALTAASARAEELARVCSERLGVIETQSTALQQLRTDNEALRQVCADRLALIEKQAAALAERPPA